MATLVAEAIGVIEFREVASKLGEMVGQLRDAAPDDGRHRTLVAPTAGMPGQGPVAVWMAQTTWRMTELLREICGSGIVMQPSENDLANPEIRPSLERFMRGKDVDVEYKSRLFRVAHELAMSSFGMRQDIYEYWHARRPEPQSDQPAARVRSARHHGADQRPVQPPAAARRSALILTTEAQLELSGCILHHPLHRRQQADAVPIAASVSGADRPRWWAMVPQSAAPIAWPP